MSEAAEDLPPEVKDENVEVECSKPKRRRRGKKKRNKSGNSTLSNKQVETKNVEGVVKNHLEKRRRRRKLLIRPVDVPKAPENSTQFIIDDHDECHLYFNFERPNPFNERGEVEGVDASNDAAFQDIDYEYHSMQDLDNTAYYLRDFENSYSNVRYEENMRLPKSDLVTALEKLENRVRDLEQKLYEKDPNSALEQLQRKLLRLQEENNLLRETQQRMHRIMAGETSSEHSHHSGSEQLNEFNDRWSDSSDLARDGSGDELFVNASSEDDSLNAWSLGSDIESEGGSDAPSEDDIQPAIQNEDDSDVQSEDGIQSDDAIDIPSDDSSQQSSLHSNDSLNTSNSSASRIVRSLDVDSTSDLVLSNSAEDSNDIILLQDCDGKSMAVSSDNPQSEDRNQSLGVSISKGENNCLQDSHKPSVNSNNSPNVNDGQDLCVRVISGSNVVTSDTGENVIDRETVMLDCDGKETLTSNNKQSDDLNGGLVNDLSSKEELQKSAIDLVHDLRNKPSVDFPDRPQSNATSEMV